VLEGWINPHPDFSVLAEAFTNTVLITIEYVPCSWPGIIEEILPYS
jgi:hypothetical protein